jgi:hypothetical protein
MHRRHRLVGLVSVVGACTLIGDTGDKRYLPEGASSTGGGGDASCGGTCPGAITSCAHPACVDGACDIVFVKAGEPCDDVGYCDGAGSCVECTVSEHCIGDVCIDHVCFQTDCDDGRWDGLETDVDCGGPDCPGCDIGEDCEVDDDCLSNICDVVCVSCAEDVDCADDTKYCDETGNCLPRKPEGAPCSDSNECQIGLECDDEDDECVDGG